MVIAPLGHIGQGHPALVVPSLLRIANHPDADGLKSLVGAVEAVRALKSFPNQAAEIVRGLSGAASRRGDTAERKAFFAQNYLNAWLDTITSLDPHTEYIDPAILEAPLVAILEGRQASSMPLSGTLAMVGRLSSPTPAELDAVRRVVQTGDTPRIRKQAQQILDAHSRN
jgi:hypothetical protein